MPATPPATLPAMTVNNDAGRAEPPHRLRTEPDTRAAQAAWRPTLRGFARLCAALPGFAPLAIAFHSLRVISSRRISARRTSAA